MKTNFQKTGRFDGIWDPKLLLNGSEVFSTIGSCFAQHIGKALVKANLNYLDFETCPIALENPEDYGYGLFSYRLGNVYTAKMLKTWLELAVNKSHQVDIIRVGEKSYDPLRLLIEPEGFVGDNNLIDARESTLRSLKRGVPKTDIFIFTLGLTEAWELEDGTPLSSHPSIINSDASARLKCYSYTDVLADMHRAIEILRTLNPKLHILLTVSPIPLTATQRTNHIISATIASKSILRAVADELTNSFDFVDYFPSYELITNHLTRSLFEPFLENKRQVSEKAVSFVMGHFTSNFPAESRTVSDIKSIDAIDRWCEEHQMVYAGAENNATEMRATDNIFLVGDSHLGLLQKSLGELGRHALGGALQNGYAWETNLFALVEDELFVPLESASARNTWRSMYQIITKSSPNPKYIITNIGAQTHRSVERLVSYFKKLNRPLNPETFCEYYLSTYAEQFKLLKMFVSMNNVKVFFVLDPPTRDLCMTDEVVLKIYSTVDKWIGQLAQEVGCEVIDPTSTFLANATHSIYSDTTLPNGKLDWTHGNAYYYSLMAEYINSVTG